MARDDEHGTRGIAELPANIHERLFELVEGAAKRAVHVGPRTAAVADEVGGQTCGHRLVFLRV
jgi:hypothetical protein